jgi:lysophospholipase L1-like esterase
MTTHPYARYVALGDSQTEGIGDGDEARGYRGWADRLAETGFMGPWAWRRIRGRSSGDGRTAMRPDLGPVTSGR